MQTIKMNLAELRAPEKNTRKHPAKQIAEMQRSLKMFGQYRPIVVDENNVILAGNGLVQAMREGGYTEADVLKYTDLTESQKKKLMVADNQIGNMGVDDFAAIEDILKSIDDFDVPGYDENTIKILIEDANEVIESVQSYGVYTPEDLQAIKNEEAKREENGFTPVPQTYNPHEEQGYAPAQPVQPQAPMAHHEEEQRTYAKTEGDKYIICPHCGEKIYL